MKIENIKLLRFISKKIKAIKIRRSIKKSLITIEPKTIFMNPFVLLFKLNFADKIPAIKLRVVRIKARKTEINSE